MTRFSLSAILVLLLFLSPALKVRAGSAEECAEAMKKLSFMRGVWAGLASGTTPDGKPYSVYQTERMGPMLDENLIVVEGRGYLPDGKVAFNAFGVVSWNSVEKKYEIRSYTQGMSGTFEMVPTDNGYVWTVPAGDATVRFTATVNGDNWREVGEVIVSGKPNFMNFEMNLKRIGNTDWPAGNPVPPAAGQEKSK